MNDFPGGAWLSSIRVLICLVNSMNECNPQILFLKYFQIGLNIFAKFTIN